MESEDKVVVTADQVKNLIAEELKKEIDQRRHHHL